MRVPPPSTAIYDAYEHHSRGHTVLIDAGDPQPVPAVIPAPEDPDQLDLGIDDQIGAAVERDLRWEQVLAPEEFDSRCLEHHADGLSLQEIADRLTADGVLTWHAGEFRAPHRQRVWRAITRAAGALAAESLAPGADQVVEVMRLQRQVGRTTKRLGSLMSLREKAESADEIRMVLNIDDRISLAEERLTKTSRELTTLKGLMVQRSEQTLNVSATVTHEHALAPGLAALAAANNRELEAAERLALERYARDTDQLELLEGEVIEAEVVEGRGR